MKRAIMQGLRRAASVGVCAAWLLGGCGGDPEELVRDDAGAGAGAPVSEASVPPGQGGTSADASVTGTTGDGGTTPPKADASAPSGSMDSGVVPSTPDATTGGVDSGDSADAGVAAGDGAVAQADAGPRWAMRDDPGKGDGKDVITIGDSWMDYFLSGGGIEAALDKEGTRYRHYGLSATTLLSGQIPRQYDSAKRANPVIKTVIMTGGGNDIMFDGGSCSTKEACEMKLAEISAALNTLWSKMSADGVKDVIYIQYSEDAGATPKENRGQGKPIPICLTGPIICHTLATTDLVMGQLLDGIHPTSAANTRIAKAVLMMMEERKIRR